MRIGIFDSGLGGLRLFSKIRKFLPQYDYLYLGDTKRVPYGNRSEKQIYEFVKEAVTYLFNNDCQLIILACNTASAKALRKIQQKYLPKAFPDRRVLGIIIPTAEEVTRLNYKKVGVLATLGTVQSETYEREFKKLNPKTKIFSLAAPLLVNQIESGNLSDKTIEQYLLPFQKIKPECLVLGCTHYPIIESRIAKFLPKSVKIINQENIIPFKIKEYLNRHLEIENILTKNNKIEIRLTKITQQSQVLSKKWFGKINLKLATL